MKANICGKKIKRLREEAGMGQVELAAALVVDHHIKIDQSDISEIEREVRGIKDYELKAFTLIFNVSADLLLND